MASTWKVLTVIGAIAAGGFVSASYLHGLQTKTDAQRQHERIDERAQRVSDDLHHQIDQHDVALSSIRYVNVRIELTQQQILDEIRRARVQERSAQTGPERTARTQELQELETRLERRGQALENSYRLVPIIPPAGTIPEQQDEGPDPLLEASAL